MLSSLAVGGLLCVIIFIATDCYHLCLFTQADLDKMGFDPKAVEKMTAER